MSFDRDATEVIGPFTRGEVIGSGGFGTVYKARGPDGTHVALKVLAPHIDSAETLKRFEREGNIRIEHPNVVRVIDAGQSDDGRSYIAFELLEGRPLNLVLEDAPLSPSLAIEIGRAMCSGLTAAHERGIVHRDLKPGNVFCTNEGTTKILDFGIARPLSEQSQSLTMAGSVIGTPGYLSPEQAKGESNITIASDLWALGVILYQALAAKNPFLRSSAVATILAVVLEEAPPLGEGGQRLPTGFAEVVHRCLQKDPAQRWSTAQEIDEALAQIDLGASMIVGVPESLAVTVPEDEQRVVALLFASEVHDLPCLDRAVRDWGGELTAMLGGAIGIFGGRKYEGDEASRAVRSALAGRDAAGFVAVGLGRVTGVGGTVSGEAVDAVERAVGARVAGVAVESEAAKSLGGVFDLEVIGDGIFEVPQKSAAHETGTFRAVSAEVPLLGRSSELAQIASAFESAFDDEHATALIIEGPPGIGKSRLRAEVLERARAGNIRVLSGRGESHRSGTALHVAALLLRSSPAIETAFLSRESTPEQRRDAVESFLTGVLGSETWAKQSLAPICRLLGLGELVDSDDRGSSDPQLLADRARVSLTDTLFSLGSGAPLALVIDDAQWVDEQSLKLLEEVAARLSERPLLLCVCTRPELTERAPHLFEGIERIRVVPRGLRAKDVGKLARAIAGRDVRDEIIREIGTRTGGNPFFVEQIVREIVEQDLLDRKFDSLPIPLDVEGAVQSRLDHLPALEKQLCKRAAVYTSGFTEPALAALEQPQPARYLDSLSRRGLVSARGRRSETEKQYRFKNELVGDVAYRMNSDDARRGLHLSAASHLHHAVGIDREEIARHWELGGESEQAATEYAQAAQQAAMRGDSESVLRCSERALALGVRAARAFELHLARAEACSFLGRRSERAESIDAALELASEPSERARVLTEKAAMLAASGQHDEGIAVASEAVSTARPLDDTDILASALARHGWLLLYAGRVSEASVAISEASALPRLSRSTAAQVAVWKAQVFTAMGDLGKRKAAYEESVARFRELGDLRRAASAECNLADTFNRVGAYEDSERALREAVEFCRRVGNRVVEGYALANLGYSLAGQQRFEEARETLERSRAIAEELQRPRLAVAIRMYIARVSLADGIEPTRVAADARAIASEALAGGLLALRATALALSARASLKAEDIAAAIRDAQSALELRDEIGTMEEDEAEIFLALAEALRADGQGERAREIIARGASRLEFLAGRIEDPTWRARFLSEVPVNRRLIELDTRSAAPD